MKNIIISLLVLVPLLTGCTNIDTQVTLNNDKSASVVSSLKYQGDLSRNYDLKNIDLFDNLYNKNFVVEKNINSDSSTINVSKKVKDLSKQDLDLSVLGFKSNLKSGRFIDVKKNFFMYSFNIDAVCDFNSQIESFKNYEKTNKIADVKGLNPEYYQKYGDVEELEPSDSDVSDDFLSNLDDDTKDFVLKSAENVKEENSTPKDDEVSASFSIKVPAFASFNNADSFKGNVYTWILRKDSPTIVKFQYIQYSGFAISVLILGGLALLILLARKIWKHDSQKRIDS